jgi:hypothetical protein
LLVADAQNLRMRFSTKRCRREYHPYVPAFNAMWWLPDMTSKVVTKLFSITTAKQSPRKAAYDAGTLDQKPIIVAR